VGSKVIKKVRFFLGSYL